MIIKTMNGTAFYIFFSVSVNQYYNNIDEKFQAREINISQSVLPLTYIFLYLVMCLILRFIHLLYAFVMPLFNRGIFWCPGFFDYWQGISMHRRLNKRAPAQSHLNIQKYTLFKIFSITNT